MSMRIAHEIISLKYLTKRIHRFKIYNMMPYGVAVAHRPLKPSALVRIQVGQPKHTLKELIDLGSFNFSGIL